MGGGAGLVACADVAVAADGARFAFSEARLGLIPAMISPYVLRALGPGPTRALFTTARAFDAAEALRLGLVHEVVPAEGLDAATAGWVDRLLDGRPGGDRRVQAPGARRLRRARAARPRRADRPRTGERRGPGGRDRVPREAKAEMGELRRILIANRGEIAVRVIRACRELGIEAVAVVTPDEDGALHAELADDVVTVASHLDGEADRRGRRRTPVPTPCIPATATWRRTRRSPSRCCAPA